MKEQWHSSPEQEWLEDQQSQGEAGTDGAQKEWREVVVQDLETAKHGSPGRKLPVKAVYSKGDMKVTVFDTTPDRDVYMRISCRGVARNIRLQRSRPRGCFASSVWSRAWRRHDSRYSTSACGGST